MQKNDTPKSNYKTSAQKLPVGLRECWVKEFSSLIIWFSRFGKHCFRIWLDKSKQCGQSFFVWLAVPYQMVWLAGKFSATQYSPIKCINLHMHIFPCLESATFICFLFELVPLFQVYATICQRIFFSVLPNYAFFQNSRNFKNVVLWNELIKVELPPWKV